MRSLHPATDAESSQLWPAVAAAHLFDSPEAFARFRSEAPWRVQISHRGEAALLERWRTHLDVLAIKGLWASPANVPGVVHAVADVAQRQGFGRVLSPLVSEEVAHDYSRAGMEHHSAVVALRFDSRRTPLSPVRAPEGIHLRRALPDELGRIITLDAECFDDFWRYDAERLARYFVEDRLMVAEENGSVIGYTLCTLVRGSGTVGRLAVSPSARGRGVGRALLVDALAHLVRAGARSVSLCTQEENAVSRSLYRAEGLEELAGRLVFLVGPAATGRRG